jgi:hypothetical protein
MNPSVARPRPTRTTSLRQHLNSPSVALTKQSDIRTRTSVACSSLTIAPAHLELEFAQTAVRPSVRAPHCRCHIALAFSTIGKEGPPGRFPSSQTTGSRIRNRSTLNPTSSKRHSSELRQKRLSRNRGRWTYTRPNSTHQTYKQGTVTFLIWYNLPYHWAGRGQ